MKNFTVNSVLEIPATERNGPFTITIPGGTTVYDWAFFDKPGIVAVYVSDGVTYIGTCAFQWCSNLAAVYVPDSVTTIGRWAFYGCPKLTVYCSEGSEAWKYCEKYVVPHSEPEK